MLQSFGSSTFPSQDNEAVQPPVRAPGSTASFDSRTTLAWRASTPASAVPCMVEVFDKSNSEQILKFSDFVKN